MSLFVDTSAWSLAFRRSAPSDAPVVGYLREALERGDEIFVTGLVLQELLQGLRGPKKRAALVDRFSVIPIIVPTLDDHVSAAALRNDCRRRGVQLGTIDALFASLCIVRDLAMVTADRDFAHAARVTGLRLAVEP